MKEIQRKISVEGIKKSVVENAGALLRGAIEVGKGMPRVVVGLVISESMRVVDAEGFRHKSGIGEGMVFVGCGVLGFGAFLAIIGVLFGGCDCGRYDDVEDGVIQSRRHCRYSAHLIIFGIIISLIGLAAIIVGVIEASRV